MDLTFAELSPSAILKKIRIVTCDLCRKRREALKKWGCAPSLMRPRPKNFENLKGIILLDWEHPQNFIFFYDR